MTTMRMPRANAQRPGLDEDWRAVWHVTYYEAAEGGVGRKPQSPCWTIEIEAHPLASNRTIGHQVWLYINRERPDIPEVDRLSAHVQLQGYAASTPSGDGNMQRIHGMRCTSCGSPEVVFTVRAWANCRACGRGQTQSEAALCSDHCEDCNAQALTNGARKRMISR
ncbi:hypothetical protein ACFY12_25795 [Streptomyces sp. NPDC001339]|uniref:hypothetical protein n=1 Tax=Streptomyces sp. NPDC001339 TaxID=3364563 RepID=UPI0036A114E4